MHDRFSPCEKKRGVVHWLCYQLMRLQLLDFVAAIFPIGWPQHNMTHDITSHVAVFSVDRIMKNGELVFANLEVIYP